MDVAGTQTEHSIWFYDLEHGIPISVPAGAKILSVAWNRDDAKIRLYVLVNPRTPKVKRRVATPSTGCALHGEGWEFAGTVTAPGKRIWHVFVEIV